MAMAPAKILREMDDERPARRRPGWWAVALAALLGTAFGIGLSITTVILPREKELTRLSSPSPFLASLSTDDVLTSPRPGLYWLWKSEGEARNSQPGRVTIWGRHFEGAVRVPASEQQKFLQDLTTRLQSMTPSRRTSAWATGTNVYAGAGEFYMSQSLDYTTEGRPGSIQVWGVGRGDQLSVFVSLYER